MAEAIEAAAKLDPEQCREAARTRFSAERMSRDYLSLYDRLRRNQPEGVPVSDAIYRL